MKMNRRDEDPNWMKNAVKKPGALREELHVKEGQNIPGSKLEKASHSQNPLLRKRANLALTFDKYRPT